jgi:hypothetical protein
MFVGQIFHKKILATLVSAGQSADGCLLGYLHNRTDVNELVGSAARCRTTKIGLILFFCVVLYDISSSAGLCQ